MFLKKGLINQKRAQLSGGVKNGGMGVKMRLYNSLIYLRKVCMHKVCQCAQLSCQKSCQFFACNALNLKEKILGWGLARVWRCSQLNHLRDFFPKVARFGPGMAMQPIETLKCYCQYRLTLFGPGMAMQPIET